MYKKTLVKKRNSQVKQTLKLMNSNGNEFDQLLKIQFLFNILDYNLIS